METRDTPMKFCNITDDEWDLLLRTPKSLFMTLVHKEWKMKFKEFFLQYPSFLIRFEPSYKIPVYDVGDERFSYFPPHFMKYCCDEAEKTTMDHLSQKDIRCFRIIISEGNHKVTDVSEFTNEDAWLIKTSEEKTLEVDLKYPFQWVRKRNSGQQILHGSNHLDMSFFNTTYLPEDHGSPKHNAMVCASKGEILFSHQLFVKYCLRPYSPIRRMIINSIPGSGKTRMMQAVLDQFACYPNLKIILFPKIELVTKFLNENVIKFTDHYRKDEVRRSQVSPLEDTSFDSFTAEYSMDATIDVPIMRTSKKQIPFPEYVTNVRNLSPQGATLVLTYRELILMKASKGDAHCSRHLFVDGTFTLGGAMILVDEAHLLFDKSKESTSLLEILEEETEHVHTLGLFTATPFEKKADITQYRQLLATTKTDPDEITRHHMMLYNGADGKSINMFNSEKEWVFKPYPKSELLALRLKKTESLQQLPRLAYNCWATFCDLRTMDGTGEVFNKAKKPLWEALKVEKITKSPSFPWSEDINVQYDIITTTAPTMVKENPKLAPDFFMFLQALYPAMGHMLKDVWTKWNAREETLSRQYTPEEREYIGLFTKGEIANLHTDRTVLVEKGMFSEHECKTLEPATITNIQERWREFTKIVEDRIVVMIDMEHGLIELPRIMTSLGMNHTVSQVADMNDTRVLCGNLQQISHPDESYQTTFLPETDITRLYNENPLKYPIMIYDAQHPEGIDLFQTTNMYIIPEFQSPPKLVQMIGRINRMCQTTLNDKNVFIYVQNDSDDETVYKDSKKEFANLVHLQTSVK
jgi:hypothetical protein